MTAGNCKICFSSSLEEIGSKSGVLRGDRFSLLRCSTCGYAFVANPLLDYGAIYSEEYYRGAGADHSIDYLFELSHPELTIRQYEWRGILKVVESMVPLSPSTRWLDFGCGNGGLVRYLREEKNCQAVGYEHGWIRSRAVEAGIPFLNTEIEQNRGSFDIVSAIEVLEHVVDPLAELRLIRSLLKPGGLFFYTTGNAAPHRNDLLNWHYFVPDIHISLYEPGTLRTALRAAGFRAEDRGFVNGWEDIIRFKVLKNLRLRETAFWERSLPWHPLSRVVDHRLQITAHPLGWVD
jgi:SAM-dependent methyltransferase